MWALLGLASGRLCKPAVANAYCVWSHAGEEASVCMPFFRKIMIESAACLYGVNLYKSKLICYSAECNSEMSFMDCNLCTGWVY